MEVVSHLVEVQYVTFPNSAGSSRWGKDRQYLDFATVDIERAVGTTYSLNPISREPSGGSIDRDGEDSADDGEELSRKHHGVG